jgi:hypothetical protein
MSRLPSTLGEWEVVQAPDYLAVLTEAGRAMPYGITGIGIDFGTVTNPTTIISLDGGGITAASRLPIDFGTV